jgi:hypothetical protein
MNDKVQAQHWKATLISLLSKDHFLEDEQGLSMGGMLTVNFGAPNIFVTLWFELEYSPNPPLGTLLK